jgi:hypothetical protein
VRALLLDTLDNRRDVDPYVGKRTEQPRIVSATRDVSQLANRDRPNGCSLTIRELLKPAPLRRRGRF